jgi:hypothetical protein
LKAAFLSLALLVLACRPLQEEEDAKLEIVEMRAIPSALSVRIVGGEPFEVALQAFDADDHEVDGVGCFFAISDLELLAFDDGADEAATLRVTTGTAVVNEVRSKGIAMARVVAGDVASTQRATVWAGVTSDEWSDQASLAESTAIKTFAITIVPSEDSEDGGVN